MKGVARVKNHHAWVEHACVGMFTNNSLGRIFYRGLGFLSTTENIKIKKAKRSKSHVVIVLMYAFNCTTHSYI